MVAGGAPRTRKEALRGMIRGDGVNGCGESTQDEERGLSPGLQGPGCLPPHLALDVEHRH